MFDEETSDSPICSACGVTALPDDADPDAFVCANPDCENEGHVVS